MRKLLMILCATFLMGMSAMAQAASINAVRFEQNTTIDWYLLVTNPEVTFDVNHNPMIGNKTYNLNLGAVETTFGTAPEDTWYTIRENATVGGWNTICMEKNITGIDGATFWTVVSERPTDFVIDEITEPQAGYGYLINFTKTTLKVQYGNETAATPVEASSDNPMQGTYAQIEPAESNELVGNYILYNNQLCFVESGAGLKDHRAYVVKDLVPDETPTPVPGRRRAYLPKPHETPTDIMHIDGDVNVNKFVKDGQFYIIRDGKIYNAIGIQR